MILLIDNYDSFTYNLYQCIGVLGYEALVVRNDEITTSEIEKLNPDKIVLSPGPGYPKDAGRMIEIIKYFYNKIPILGICLGHQGIGEAFGENIVKAKEIIHGKVKKIELFKDKIFNGLNDEIDVTRYHSLVIEKNDMDGDIDIIATGAGEIMAIRHKKYPVYGLQFHPESYGTRDGMTIIKNFLEM